MLKVAIEYRIPIDIMTADKKTKLRRYELDNEEWESLKDILRVLKLYKDLTLKFSQEGVATIAHVLPAMDKIEYMLQDELLGTSKQGRRSLNPAVKEALRDAQKVMNKYYAKSDMSYAYRIGMILHPGLKLKYFERHEWPEDWIEEAVSITRSQF
ncbi:hypothetical protein DFH09DRAFT_1009157, partial [Mycena vulgaris]